MTRTIDVALTQLGVCEATGNNDGVPAERYMRGDRLPWCAGFILWCNARSEDEIIALTAHEQYFWRNVEALEVEMRRRNWWMPGGNLYGHMHPDDEGLRRMDEAPRYPPRRNDLVFFGSRAGSDGGGSHHVGIIIEAGIDLDGVARKIRTVEGNYGNRVAEVVRILADPATCITGYARLPLKS